MNGHPIRRWTSALMLLSILLAGIAGPARAPLALAADTPAPSNVTIAGSLQDELGCSGDWDPACANTHLTNDANDDVWQGSWTVPAGAFEYKAALNDGWTENYGKNAQKDGANIPIVGTGTAVKFYYDHKSHWVTDNVNSVIAVAPGDFQSELGCSSDWDPSCLRSWLQDPDGDGTYTFVTTALPAGNYEGKVALNESWDVNYGQGGALNGANIAFSVASAGRQVSFSYNAASHVLTITAGSDPADAALVRPALTNPIQDRVFYFVLPDRFQNGNIANDTGGLSGDRLQTGFDKTDKGFYHGGDIQGLRNELDYLQDMGVSAVWMTPIFKNKPVQGSGADVSAGYHGYWITDFTQIDPHFGTNQELTDLIADAHSRGIKVFFDIITNHTADVIRYEGGQYTYRNKTNFPYKDASGGVFDDKNYAGGTTFPPLDANTSFPYKPVFATAADATSKTPAWLNNPIYYHNRGDSSFSGENSEYGDFFGLDDLFTEQPAVVDGMTAIYKTWITDFGIDGYRIDTVKHVNLEFWQKFSPAILEYAEANGKPDFFMYGEVFDSNPAFDSVYTTAGKLPATLDFPFQSAATSFANGGATNGLRDLYANDDYYTDADSNAYSLPTFLGNHDMGRIGRFIATSSGNVGASDDELLGRDKLAHALMFFARGMPVIYYGDEQGFTGDGGDKDARQDMFPSQVESYKDDDQIGTTKPPDDVDGYFDNAHPLYQAIEGFADVRAANTALWRGAQINRYSSDAAGIYAFSRIDRNEQIEYLVVVNNAETEQTATFKTFSANMGFSAVLPAGGAALTSNASADISVTVPPLGVVIYKANAKLASSASAPAITISKPASGGDVGGRVEVVANLSTDQLAEVTFAVKVGDGDFKPIGTDTNAPYRIFYDVSKLANDTPMTFKAIVSDLNDHINSASVAAVVKNETGGGGSCATPAYAIIHYQRPAGDYDGWGLHLWGDAIDPSEGTDWGTPKLPNGEDDYGVFWFIKLADPSQPVNYIIHKGDEKDTPNDRLFTPSETPQIWTIQGDATNHVSASDATKTITFRYYRPGGDYAGWGLHLWGDAIDPSEVTTWDTPKPFTVGTDGYATAVVKLADPSQPVNFIIHKGDDKDTPADRSVVPNELLTGINWVVQGDAANHPTEGAARNKAVIHYHRTAGDYGDYSSNDFNNFWGMHVWTGAVNPTEWQTPLKPVRADRFGQVFEVPLVANATTLNYILHRGDTKDLPEDQELDLATWGHEVWIIQSTPGYLLPLAPCDGTPQNKGDLSKQKAHWIDRSTIAVDIDGGAANSYALYYDPTGAIKLDDARHITGGQSIVLTFDPAGLSSDQKARFPHLAAFSALKVSQDDLAKIPELLKGQLAVAVFDAAGTQVEATGVQIPGVLDDLYTYKGTLGIEYGAAPKTFGHGSHPSKAIPTLRLWAPTARSVKLLLFNDSKLATASTAYPMTGDPASGVWSVTGDASWSYKFYLYDVEVYVPSTGKVEHNQVTDPYSISLSMNSTRSQIVDLNADALKPPFWDFLKKPALKAPEDIVIYELHLRDFSINDTTVPAASRGTFDAFNYYFSNGMRHLRGLADAGLSHVHLLPLFDIASINEDKSQRQEPDAANLATFPPDSDKQAAAVEALADKDGFNWGYDPYHYTTPEGSYARQPDGASRIKEFRGMVKALNISGLRVIMDVVYNHTSESGQGEKSVLDKVVPGYYYRLDLDGKVETSTCCQNTASEHAMFEKLMIDSVLTWTRQYKVDAFRFDLMGHHMKSNMLNLRAALDKLTLSKDGVDGKAVYLYGEGWNFGEVANNARGVNATQLNMAGTGIGTFSDRLRDAVRGGGPFDDGENKKIQGFVSGLYYDPNALLQGGPDAQKQRLLLYQDQIKVGLAGNLADFQLTDRNGNLVKGSQVDYNGSPTGYTKDPQEVITYIEAHDNETLFDKIQYAAPAARSVADRVRMQNVGASVVLLSQGVPFFQAGQDLLRSKSLDRNSYNSGDWFNRLDWTYKANNWGVGLPPGENESNWPVMQPLLANPQLKPGKADILDAADHFAEMLRVRQSSPLFRLRTAQEIEQKLFFLNNGPNQTPGLIVMCIDDTKGANLDPNYRAICVAFNASNQPQNFSNPWLKGKSMILHPILLRSADAATRGSRFNAATGAMSIAPRTTAVFVWK